MAENAGLEKVALFSYKSPQTLATSLVPFFSTNAIYQIIYENQQAKRSNLSVKPTSNSTAFLFSRKE